MITKTVAENLSIGAILHHCNHKNADGSALRCRVTGKCKTWKRNPKRFRLPVKYGLYNCFYITEDNAKEWNTDLCVDCGKPADIEILEQEDIYVPVCSVCQSSREQESEITE